MSAMSLGSPGADFGFSSLSLSAGGAPSPGDQSWSSMDPSLVTTTSQRIMAGENTKLLTASQRDQVTQRLHVDQNAKLERLKKLKKIKADMELGGMKKGPTISSESKRLTASKPDMLARLEDDLVNRKDNLTRKKKDAADEEMNLMTKPAISKKASGIDRGKTALERQKKTMQEMDEFQAKRENNLKAIKAQLNQEASEQFTYHPNISKHSKRMMERKADRGERDRGRPETNLHKESQRWAAARTKKQVEEDLMASTQQPYINPRSQAMTPRREAAFKASMEGNKEQVVYIDPSSTPPGVRYQERTYRVRWRGPPSKGLTPLHLVEVDPLVKGEVRLSDGARFENPPLPAHERLYQQGLSKTFQQRMGTSAQLISPSGALAGVSNVRVVSRQDARDEGVILYDAQNPTSKVAFDFLLAP